VIARGQLRQRDSYPPSIRHAGVLFLDEFFDVERPGPKRIKFMDNVRIREVVGGSGD
jgi:hypothetical protein